jgi:5'(3')-deoxyribonucleotidase
MNKPKIYLDMDGVVADFRAYATGKIGTPSPAVGDLYPDQDWQRLRDNPHLFLELPLMARATELVNIARKYRDQLGWELQFLTAIPHNNDLPWAFHDKAEWARLHFTDIAVHFGPYSTDKHLHCSAGDILVDDRMANCRDWESAGGVAFRVARTLDSVIVELSADYKFRVDQVAHAMSLRRLVVETL